MKKIHVDMRLLGKNSITVNKRPVQWHRASLTKPWCLLCLLAISGGQYLSTEDIVTELWPGTEDARAIPSLKNAVLALRKELAYGTQIDGGDCICYGNGGYRIGKAVVIHADFVDFQKQFRKLRRTNTAAFEDRCAMYHTLAQGYGGHFTHNAVMEDWLTRYSLNLGAAFLEAMGEYFCGLWEHERYEEIAAVYGDVRQRIEPCDEMTVYFFRALHVLKRSEMITAEYQNIRMRYEARKQTDSPVFMEIKYIVMQAEETSRANKMALDRVKRELEPAEKRPAALVDYARLRELVAQQPARYAMVLFTFGLPKRPSPRQRPLKEVIDTFIEIARQALRGYDLIVPYTGNQCLVVLPNHSLESCERVKERLYTSFVEQVNDHVYVSADVTAIS